VSQENVAIVRDAFDAFLSGEEAAMLALASPQIVVRQFPDQLDVRDYHGHEGLRRMMAGWIGMWDDWTIELLSAHAEGDLVYATALQRGRGKGSGAPMESHVTFIFGFADTLIVRWQMFHSEHEAREAARLEAGG
jgi:ketosteroid isomerase-like protein